MEVVDPLTVTLMRVVGPLRVGTVVLVGTRPGVAVTLGVVSVF